MKQYLRILKVFSSFVSKPIRMKQNLAAGLLMWRETDGNAEYFLVHPGGPFFKSKDVGVWSIPKGIPEEGEGLLDTAQREFFEETGIHPSPPFRDIGSVRQKGGKLVHAWMFSGAWDPQTGIKCNTFALEWPPRSGKIVNFPEVDRARWMDYHEATRMINSAQIPFLEKARALHGVP
jgi:predicted NUDIX family NTP pyrophosphohydrolase